MKKFKYIIIFELILFIVLKILQSFRMIFFEPDIGVIFLGITALNIIIIKKKSVLDNKDMINLIAFSTFIFFLVTFILKLIEWFI